MKRIIILSLLCILLLQACQTCDIRYDLGNANKDFTDIEDFSNEKLYGIRFGVETGKDVYKYINDSLNPRLQYQFSISTPSMPLVKLHSFSFTREKDGDTIPYKLHYKTNLQYKKDSTYVPYTEIASLPFSIDTSLIGKRNTLKIIAECSQSYYETKKKIYISYDIEVGDERIIKKNIEYKRRWQIDCRPKW